MRLANETGQSIRSLPSGRLVAGKCASSMLGLGALFEQENKHEYLTPRNTSAGIQSNLAKGVHKTVHMHRTWPGASCQYCPDAVSWGLSLCCCYANKSRCRYCDLCDFTSTCQVSTLLSPSRTRVPFLMCKISYIMSHPWTLQQASHPTAIDQPAEFPRCGYYLAGLRSPQTIAYFSFPDLFLPPPKPSAWCMAPNVICAFLPNGMPWWELRVLIGLKRKLVYMGAALQSDSDNGLILSSGGQSEPSVSVDLANNILCQIMVTVFKIGEHRGRGERKQTPAV